VVRGYWAWLFSVRVWKVGAIGVDLFSVNCAFRILVCLLEWSYGVLGLCDGWLSLKRVVGLRELWVRCRLSSFRSVVVFWWVVG